MLFGTETEYGYYAHSSARGFESWQSLRLSPFFPPEDFLGYAVEAARVPFVANRRGSLIDCVSTLWSVFQDFPEDLFEEAERIALVLGLEERDIMVREAFRVRGISGMALANGARFYVDLGHPEYSTPECTSALDIVRYQRAGDLLMELGRIAVEEKTGAQLRIHRDNSDRHGSSFAAHENYLLDPATFTEIITANSRRGHQLMSFLVSRQIFAGAGKVRCEDAEGRCAVPFQLSQRADFMRVRWGRDTMRERALINTRDHPYADPSRFRRLHVILGDANMCDVALWLKVGITAMVLTMLADDYLASQHSFVREPMRDAVAAMKAISHDPTLRATVEWSTGERVTALEIQQEFARLLRQYFSDVREPSGEEQALLNEYERVLAALDDVDRNAPKLIGVLDWVTKRSVLTNLASRENIPFSDPKMIGFCRRFHSTDADCAFSAPWLRRQGIVRSLVSEDEVRRALVTPPETTRAAIRNRLILRFGDTIEYCWWDGMVIRQRDSRRLRVRFPDPFGGDRDRIVDAVVAACDEADPIRKLQKLGAVGIPSELLPPRDW